MSAYATVEELEIRMRKTFGQDDVAYATSILDEIGSYLTQVVPIDESDAAQAQNLKYASLEMAAKAMQSAYASDIASTTTQAGVYSETITYAQPYANNNWSKLLQASGYARVLGVNGSIGFARPSFGRLEPDHERR